MLRGGGVGRSEDALLFGASLPGTFGFGSRGFPTDFSPRVKAGSRAMNCVEKSLLQGGVLFSLGNFIWDSDCRYFPCLLCSVIARCVQPSPVGRREARRIF